ncbi:metallophosphoesterase [Methylobacterium sp. WL6]|uniref:metallophosphoesterase family protein n=1 Tax=Methylobacterium sp. WL6 TaxID=2603901 RepID=UPI001650A3E1|nr:metallophosphoesterase [Methylobacterium sp. WL6]
MSALFRFVHTSDFHFCVEPRRVNILSLYERRTIMMMDTAIKQGWNSGFISLAKPASFSEAIVSATALFCYKNKDEIDGIIITGDLATTGYQSDIKVAHDFVKSAPADGYVNSIRRPTLQAADADILVLPGNHDKYSNLYAAPSSRFFELNFHLEMPNLKNRISHEVREKNGKVIALVFADFSLKQRKDATSVAKGPYGQGCVYEDVLKELVEVTRSLKQEFSGCVIIWGIHFAPFNCGSTLQLIDFEAVNREAKDENVSLILCGHTHTPAVLKQDGPTIFCAGSAGAIDKEDRSYIHLVEIDIGVETKISRKNFKISKSRDDFIFSGVDL